MNPLKKVEVIEIEDDESITQSQEIEMSRAKSLRQIFKVKKISRRGKNKS